MDLLAVTPYYAPEGGGLERYAHEILRRLAREHAVEVLSFTREDPGDAQRDGVRVRRREPSLVLGNAPLAPGFPRELIQRIDALQPDVVLAHTPVPFPAESACLAAWRRDVPFALTYHAGRLQGSSAALNLAAGAHRRTLERLMLSRSDALIAVSPTVREQALARHRERVTLVPPGVDAARFSPGSCSQRPTVLFVGPLDTSYAWKGLDTLWTAFQRVRERVPEARLQLVGEGDRLEELRARAEEPDGALHVPGRLSDDELVQAYRGAHVAVLPSTSEAESFGMVLAEANACGTPVVGSDVGGIPSFVEHGHNGLLARPGDARDLAGKLTRLLEDPDEAAGMGKRGRQRVLAEHDWDRLAERTERVLLEASSPTAT